MNKFIFVVCGGKEHIKELNFSLKFLRHFSKNEIIVITDIERNEIKIDHDNVIDIKTSKEYSNHEASIYLKTGLNKFLPSGNNYCYLDGDIVAISKDVDQIFKFYASPIIFAKDHCTINEFSPHAMNCNCNETYLNEKNAFNKKLSEVFGDINLTDSKIKKQSNELLEIFNTYRKQPVKYFLKNIKYILCRYILPIKELNLKNFRFQKSNRCWYNMDNQIVLFHYPYYAKRLWNISDIRYIKAENKWISRDGKVFEFNVPSCNHLSEYLKKEYKIDIPDNWQHWNGGVFLFNNSSKDFLNYWHEQTIKEFSNPYTKTRDQGTLALSVWKFGLQDHPTIPQKFNWITEYANNNIAWDKNLGYTRDGFKTIFHPISLHIYHEWGKTRWSIWNSVKEIEKKENIN
jgi:hypothetical protein